MCRRGWLGIRPRGAVKIRQGGQYTNRLLRITKKDGSLPYVSEPRAVTLENRKFLDARLRGVWGIGPWASVFLCVISRIRERTEGYADVEVGEDELDTGFWSVRTFLVKLRGLLDASACWQNNGRRAAKSENLRRK